MDNMDQKFLAEFKALAASYKPSNLNNDKVNPSDMLERVDRKYGFIEHHGDDITQLTNKYIDLGMSEDDAKAYVNEWLPKYFQVGNSF